ncbi:hypothetical protein FKM82_026725 [Ascaphus truei]
MPRDWHLSSKKGTLETLCFYLYLYCTIPKTTCALGPMFSLCHNPFPLFHSLFAAAYSHLKELSHLSFCSCPLTFYLSVSLSLF